mmetsp:Transcript_11270/g.24276  ORF Transcript_11270/g.24276 Transcript_11270/m.24276 type:complete len:341 (+) Transcript_11270:134-1156(+)
MQSHASMLSSHRQASPLATIQKCRCPARAFSSQRLHQKRLLAHFRPSCRPAQHEPATTPVPSAAASENQGQSILKPMDQFGYGSAALAGLGIMLAGPALADVVSNPATSELGALSIPGIVGDSPVREGFVSGFLLIFFSEIGDKTFFIALLLALKQSKGAVFAGTFGALAVMTVISVLLGQGLHQLDELVPQGEGAKLPFDDIIAAALLIWFGVKTLQDAKDAGESAAEEKEEAQEVVDKFGAEDAAKLILSTFALVFAAEWGDKSFLATIALAAASSPLGVTAGAVAGHGVATGIAVAGGSFLSKYFSESVLQYIGGSLFLVFAAATIVDIVVEVQDKL